MKSLKLILVFLSITFACHVNGQTEAYTTKTGKKYHRENCRYLSRSKIKTTIQKAKNFGYMACRVCKPLEVKNEKKIKEVKKSNKVEVNKDSIGKKTTVAKQCTGKTKDGTRCKRKTTHKSGQCHQHRER